MRSLLTLLLVAGSHVPALASDPLVLPFEIDRTTATILVKGEVHGRAALLILDTGASTTLFRHDLVDLGAGGLGPSTFSSEGPGLRADGRWTTATFRLGGRTWFHRKVVGMRLDEVSRAFRRDIDGILGQDLLREFRSVTIDFDAKEVRLTP